MLHCALHLVNATVGRLVALLQKLIVNMHVVAVDIAVKHLTAIFFRI